ncbi:Por secretion system C-terminal sorting domain-containing protein [Tenacibaculum sp. MAR_2009_124]|uniref:endonuclease n=1 Tax=Tenacibaculum sp. MAR_2009_124 TaxID=1250059 RepID=UPI0008963E3B|nr:endonuclease [Tenacibaculum sp. MAR_2009_124]SEB50435.1 Por secretion system C-terminal sorting domain-containing protein [Tenacibaculum sp. MAR_2009_124]
MKSIIPFILFLTSFVCFSQIPTYYNNVNINLTGSSLKNELATKIISTHHTNLSYTPGVWNTLKQTDLDPINNSKVLLIYGYSDTDGNYRTDRTRSKNANGGSAGTQWNREHVYPKSLGNPNLGTSGPGSDVHHLRPCDISYNSSRGSKKFAQGSGTSGVVSAGWYPGDEWKGDVARMMLYMYLRYGSQCLPKNVAVGSSPSSDSNMVTLLLQWNADDPVSNFEKQRNPIIENLQGNRNPFIDNPAFATKIWGGPQAEDVFGNGSSDTQAPTAPANLTVSNITQTSLSLAWRASSDNVAVTGYDIYQNSTKITSTTSTSYTISALSSSTTYSFYIKAKDAAGNISPASSTISATTSGSSSGVASELLISEYIEGSSYNKAIELANFTGNTLNLSSYSLKKASNGGGWSNTLALNGSLLNGKTYVIAHSSASTSIKNNAQKTNSNVLSFNGNDAVGLFKNNVLIDLVGDPNSSANFGKDKTLQRKTNTTSPNSNYIVSEWNSLPKNTFSNLGNHSIDGGSSDVQAPSTPSNLTSSNITQNSVTISWSSASDNIGVVGYDVYRNGAKITTISGTTFTVSGLSPSTTYSFYVKAKDAANNISGNSNTESIKTLSNAITYCNSKGNNSSYEYIDYVSFGGVSNSSGDDNGYKDYTSSVGYLSYGNNSIILSAGFSGSSYLEFWKVWIDFNRNGTFEASEEVVSDSSTSSSNLNYTINIASSVPQGQTRMRVSMKWDSAQTSCESFSYGEVEDYSVMIGSSNSRNRTIKNKNYSENSLLQDVVYPNPVMNTFSIKTEGDLNSTFKLINQNGQVIKSGNTGNKNIDISNLNSGVYLIQIKNGSQTILKKVVKK